MAGGTASRVKHAPAFTITLPLIIISLIYKHAIYTKRELTNPGNSGYKARYKS